MNSLDTVKPLRVRALLPLLALAACSTRGATPTPAASSSAAPAASAPAAVDATRCALRSPRRIERAAAPEASSSVELVRAGGRVIALVADTDERALHAVDVETMQQIGVTPLPGRPGHVLALADGRVAVAIRETGRVALLEPADDALAQPFDERCSVEVAAEPWSLAETGDRLLVASGYGAALTVLGEADLRVERRVPLPREPRGMIVANGGATAFVTHAVGGVVSAVDLREGGLATTISVRAGWLFKGDGVFDEEHPRASSQGYALASLVGVRADGTRGELRIFAPNVTVDPGVGREGGASAGYGSGAGAPVRIMAPIVSVLDPIAKRSITNHAARAFDDPREAECLLPRGAVADEAALFVACADLGAVIELDPGVADPSAAERRRVQLSAGPTALALAADGKRLVAWSEIDRSLSRIERAGSAPVSAITLWRRAGERDPRIDRGRLLFHATRDARISAGRACASCHPDGRDDGLVWTSPDGRRQTITLAGRIDGTAPYGWFGDAPTVRDHLKKTFLRLGGDGFGDSAQDQADLDALIAYVTQIPLPPASPPADPKAAERGKRAFASYCQDCHKSGGTDGQTHDVGSGVEGERAKAFDTPSLRGVSRTAPYFHDGRYATLEELLSARDQRMFPGALSEPDQRDLLAYLETL